MRRYICYFTVEYSNNNHREEYFAKKEYSEEELIEDLLFWARVNRKKILLNSIVVQSAEESIDCL